jgi:hypothetical protein
MCCICSSVYPQIECNPLIYRDQKEDPVTICLEQAQAMRNDTNIVNIMHTIVQLRQYLEYQGCCVPPITALLDACRCAASQYGLKVNDEVFEALLQEFGTYEHDPVGYDSLNCQKKDKKPKELVKISSRSAMGFLKFAGGTLLCIIPCPPVQAAGASLAVLGVCEMFDANLPVNST